jgi:hypothetical protein
MYQAIALEADLESLGGLGCRDRSAESADQAGMPLGICLANCRYHISPRLIQGIGESMGFQTKNHMQFRLVAVWGSECPSPHYQLCSRWKHFVDTWGLQVPLANRRIRGVL